MASHRRLSTAHVKASLAPSAEANTMANPKSTASSAQLHSLVEQILSTGEQPRDAVLRLIPALRQSDVTCRVLLNRLQHDTILAPIQRELQRACDAEEMVEVCGALIRREQHSALRILLATSSLVKETFFWHRLLDSHQGLRDIEATMDRAISLLRPPLRRFSTPRASCQNSRKPTPCFSTEHKAMPVPLSPLQRRP